MDPNWLASTEKVNEIYDRLGYYDLYGGSLILFFVLLVILCFAFSYASVMTNIQPIKQNWTQERCNPKVIPFAGFINKPDGVSVTKFTQDNFTYCMQNILTSITGYALEPLTFVTANLTSVFGTIAKTLNSIRTIISNVRTNMLNIVEQIYGKVVNVLVPLRTMIISFADMVGKVNGVLTATLFTSLSTYYALKALLGSVLQFIVMLLTILAGLIVGMWIIPFTWPAAISGTAIFLSISVPLLIIMTFMNKVMNIPITGLPGLPGPGQCFHGDTLIQTEDGTEKPIKDISVGDRLKNGAVVTATMKLEPLDETLYFLHGVLVTGSHRVQLAPAHWVLVSEHPDSQRIGWDASRANLYCLNTTTKRIQVKDLTFADWDEVLDDSDVGQLLSPLNKASTEDIHRFYDGGFFPETQFKLWNGTSREIRNLEPGDLLYDGSRVIGMVQVSAAGIQSREPASRHGVNLRTPGGSLTSLGSRIEKGDTITNKLYHLVTDTETFFVDGIQYSHYNSCVEHFLDKYKAKLLSTKYV
jgi:hypothetical protein